MLDGAKDPGIPGRSWRSQGRESSFNQLVRNCFNILPTGSFLFLTLPSSGHMTLGESLCDSGPPRVYSVCAAFPYVSTLRNVPSDACHTK